MHTKIQPREIFSLSMSISDQEIARAAQRCIMEALDHSRAAAITLTTDTGEHPSVDVPPGALKLIGQLLGALSEGGSITLPPAKREFTTVEAANFLNVSRPFVIKEIEQGRLHHRLVYTHRRVAFEDLVSYDNRLREKQATALDALADNAREQGLDY